MVLFKSNQCMYNFFSLFQKIHNKTWPAWVTPKVFDKLYRFNMMKYKIWHYTPEMTRIRAGIRSQRVASQCVTSQSIISESMTSRSAKSQGVKSQIVAWRKS